MKVFAIFVVIFAVLAAALAHQNSICEQEHSKDGEGIIACMAYFPSWTYRLETNDCIEFVYGGCGGNDNRFESKDDCEQKCLQ